MALIHRDSGAYLRIVDVDLQTDVVHWAKYRDRAMRQRGPDTYERVLTGKIRLPGLATARLPRGAATVREAVLRAAYRALRQDDEFCAERGRWEDA